MSAATLSLASTLPPDSGPLLFVTGDMGPRGFHVVLRGKLLVLPLKVFEHLLELIAAWHERDDHWLFNQLAYSCGRNDDYAIANAVAMDLMAHDRVRHLRKRFGADVESGRKAYRLDASLGRPIVSSWVFSIPSLDAKIIARLRLALDCHGDDALMP